ncbi:MAG: hypothetical protein AB7U41_03690 [Dongiaceae bacterium]
MRGLPKLRLKKPAMKEYRHRTDLRPPGQPVVGGHKHAPHIRRPKSKLAPARGNVVTRRQDFLRWEEDDSDTDMPGGVWLQNPVQRPRGISDILMWKFWRSPRPRGGTAG